MHFPPSNSNLSSHQLTSTDSLSIPWNCYSMGDSYQGIELPRLHLMFSVAFWINLKCNLLQLLDQAFFSLCVDLTLSALPAQDYYLVKLPMNEEN